jgi:hypothetical protein
MFYIHNFADSGDTARLHVGGGGVEGGLSSGVISTGGSEGLVQEPD